MKFTIKAIRVALDVKPKELAARFGVSTSFISHIEAGRNKMSENQLKDFAILAGISFAEIQSLIELEYCGASYQYILKKYLEKIVSEKDICCKTYIMPKVLKAIRISENEEIEELSRALEIPWRKIQLFEQGAMGINEVEISKYATHYNVDKSLLYQLAKLEDSGKTFKEILKTYLKIEKQE